MDPVLYRSLMQLIEYKGNVEEDFGANFTIQDDSTGVSKTVELMPGGKNVNVTNNNRSRYVFLTAQYRLDTQIKRQCQAFLAGFTSIIQLHWISMFDVVSMTFISLALYQKLTFFSIDLLLDLERIAIVDFGSSRRD